MTLEQRLAEKLNEQAKSAAALGIPAPKRLLQQAAQYGAADAVSAQLKSCRLSDNFDALADAGRLDLSAEALVVSREFGPPEAGQRQAEKSCGGHGFVRFLRMRGLQ